MGLSLELTVLFVPFVGWLSWLCHSPARLARPSGEIVVVHTSLRNGHPSSLLVL